MRDLIPVDESAGYRAPAIIALDSDAPSMAELFTFMRDAEQRFESLRMRMLDRRWTAAGEQRETIEIWLRHPGHAKVVTRRGTDAMSRDFDIWASDGTTVRTFNARSNTATERRARTRVVGATDPELPPPSRVYACRTALPVETVVDTFIHPHGLAMNVLRSGPVEVLGAARVSGREALMIEARHPRVSHVLTDRPDRWLEVGVDRMSGLLLLLVEHVADRVTRHVQVLDLELDPPIPDEAFRIHLSGDVTTIY